MVLGNHKHQFVVTEERLKARACMTEQTPVSKDPAELLRSGVAVNLTRQFL
jgi:hypothetical protein